MALTLLFHEISLIYKIKEAEVYKDKKTKNQILPIVLRQNYWKIVTGAIFTRMALTALFSRYFTYKTGSGRQNIKTKN